MARIPETILKLVTTFFAFRVIPPADSLQLGDSCISYNREFQGVCAKISDCIPAIYAHSKGTPLEYCQPTGEYGTILVVCCESAHEPFPKFHVKEGYAMLQRPSFQERWPPPPREPHRPPYWRLQPPHWGQQPSYLSPLYLPRQPWISQLSPREPQTPHLSYPSPPKEQWDPPLPLRAPPQPSKRPSQPQRVPQQPTQYSIWSPPSTIPSITPASTPESISVTTPASLLFDKPVQDEPHEDDTEDCLLKPDYAVKAKKTEEKSWNECISYAGSVFPCLYSEAQDGDYSQPLCFRDAPSAALEFPHMAMLGFLNGRKIDWRCSGSLISKDWVLTAAHCIFYKGSEVKYVRLGETDLSTPYYSYELYKVVDTRVPENYKGDSMYDDVALVWLDKSVIFTPKVRPACLHTGKPIDDSRMTATGWSDTYPMTNKTSVLQKVELEKFSHKECSQELPKVKSTPLGILDKTQICAGHHKFTSDTCKGFSGGPLQITNDDSVYCTYLIVGVTSFGRGHCGTPGLPAVYTRVSAYIDWIEDHVWPDESDE